MKNQHDFYCLIKDKIANRKYIEKIPNEWNEDAKIRIHIAGF